MRIIFMGYHNIGYACLEVLIDLCRDLGDEIVAVVTHADDPRENIWFASVQDLAFENYLPVYQPGTPTTRTSSRSCGSCAPDFLFSCYYRHMLKQPLLDLPRLGGAQSARQPAAPLPGPLSGELGPGPRRDRDRRHPALHGGKSRPGRHRRARSGSPSPGGYGPDPVCPDDRGRRNLNAGDLPPAAGGHCPPAPPGPEPGLLFRRPHDRQTASLTWDKDALEIYNLVRAVTHPYPGAFTHLRGKRLFIWAGKPLAEPPASDQAVPGGRGWYRATCRGKGCWWPPAGATSSSPRPSGRASRSF